MRETSDGFSGNFVSLAIMLFHRSWILRGTAFVFLFLMTDFIFNYGITSCTGLHIQSKGNSSTEETSQNKFLNTYFNSIWNKSRELEEVIYSDILNNLRSLIRNENNLTLHWEASSSEEEDGGTVAREVGGKSENIECGNRNKTNSQRSVNSLSSFKNNVFLSGTNEFLNKQGGEYVYENFLPRDSGGFRESEYLLGYSGNPFGSRRPITGIVEMPETEALATGVADPRKKRSVVHLYNMVLCTTGCNPFAYKGYGCYCGFLGSGFVVDGIDSCCKMHDWCYNSAGCPMFFEYFIPYLWKCYRRQPLCAIDHGYYGGPSSCAQRLCECDRQLALCLRRFPCPSTKALCTSSPWRLLQNILMI